MSHSMALCRPVAMLDQGLKPLVALLNRACCTACFLWHLPPLLLNCLRSYLRKDGHAACVLRWILGVYGFKLKGHLPPSKDLICDIYGALNRYA